REKNPEIIPDLSKLDLGKVNLSGADLHKAKLYGTNLCEARLLKANLCWADLCNAELSKADLRYAILIGAKFLKAKVIRANFSNAILSGADLSKANFMGANLSNADLQEAILVNTNLEGANLTGCSIYGISAWGVKLTAAKQKNLLITPAGEPKITVDNLEVAQFIYLLLHNEKIRDVIDTIGKKAVLILGRFTPDREVILDAIKEELRKRDYLPILFKFEGPSSRDKTETISILAHLSRFIIADITDARSVPQELQAIVPNLPSVPVQPLLQTSKDEYGLFEHFRNYPWVLAIHRYKDLNDLLTAFGEKVIASAETKVLEIRTKR
ncbi:MAG: pentapeptide repeat-containing protein, partial [candidate division KSB1 bacterium]|nr:pentapeptide repeat-containing protein [candidate division KSB1 bacterium]